MTKTQDVLARFAQLQTEATVGRQQGVADHLGSHLARAQDKVRQDGESSTALQVVHWMRQMVTPFKRTWVSWEWRVKHPPPRQVAFCVS